MELKPVTHGSRLSLMGLWDALPRDRYGVGPWVWVQLESNQSPGPFPFVGGVAPEVVRGTARGHSLFLACIETAISDIYFPGAVLMIRRPGCGSRMRMLNW